MPASKLWSVVLPISGTICVEVEAPDEDAAIEKALDGDLDLKDIQSWNAHRQIVQGNVLYAEQNEASAECIDEGDEVGNG